MTSKQYVHMFVELDSSGSFSKGVAGIVLRFYILVCNMIVLGPLSDDKMLDINVTGPLSRFLCCCYVKCAFIVAINHSGKMLRQ